MSYIEIKNLSLSFGSKKVLDSISYRFENGITILRGDSGVGKTSLLHTIAGIYKDFSGEIEISTNSNLAYCLQEDLFFNNLTVEENMHLKFVTLNKDAKNEIQEIERALSLFGILPLMSSKTKTLSGGERQRLKMALITLSEPDIILLDEPTAKLDNENVQGILEVIEQVWKNKLILIVTHDDLSFSTPSIELKLRGGKLL